MTGDAGSERRALLARSAIENSFLKSRKSNDCTILPPCSWALSIQTSARLSLSFSSLCLPFTRLVGWLRDDYGRRGRGCRFGG